MSFFCLFFNKEINDIDIYPEEPDMGFKTYDEAEYWLDSNENSLEGWVLSHYPDEEDIDKFREFQEDTEEEEEDSDEDYVPSDEEESEEDETDYDSEEYETNDSDDDDESDLSSGYESE